MTRARFITITTAHRSATVTSAPERKRYGKGQGKRRYQTPLPLAGFLGLVFSGLLWAVLISGVQSDQRVIDNGQQAIGTVERVFEQDTGSGRRGRDITVGSVSFTTSNGYRESVVHKIRGGGGEELVGTSVTVYYQGGARDAVVEQWRKSYGWKPYAVALLTLACGYAFVKGIRDFGARCRARKRAKNQ